MPKNKTPEECDHKWEKDRSPFGGADTGDVICRKCGKTEWGGNVVKRQDAVQAARRVVDVVIRKSESGPPKKEKKSKKK